MRQSSFASASVTNRTRNETLLTRTRTNSVTVSGTVVCQYALRSMDNAPNRLRLRSGLLAAAPIRRVNPLRSNSSVSRSISINNNAGSQGNGASIPRNRINSPRSGTNVPGKLFLGFYRTTIPVDCKYAIRADQNGSMHVMGGNQSLKLMPSRRFTQEDMQQFSAADKKGWTVQSIMNWDGECYVLFEGCDSTTVVKQSFEFLRQTAANKLNDANDLQKFLETLEKQKNKEYEELLDEVRKTVKKEQYCLKIPNFLSLLEDPKHSFWNFQDLSYYQSKILNEIGEASIFYVNGTNAKITKYPDFYMITNNLMTNAVIEKLKKQPWNKHIREFDGRKRTWDLTQIVCESESCVCSKRFDMLYSHNARPFWHVESTRRLDMRHYAKTMNTILVECSDACGCSSSCPNRMVQRGAKKPLAIVYELTKGYGLRAIEAFFVGDFVAEYRGQLYFGEEIVGDKSYEVGFSTFEGCSLDARVYGNVGRFPNHSCDPNLVFLEAHSRVSESELLIPKMILIAIRDIQPGEELTISYYPSIRAPKTGGVKCMYGSEKCRKLLPAC